MDDELVKQVISIGDLCDRWLINNLKLNHMDTSQHDQIYQENEAIEKVIKEMVNSEIMFQDEKRHLSEVLQEQWDVLDAVHDESLSTEERGRYALKAQELNIDRIKHKNAINTKVGSYLELKSYG